MSGPESIKVARLRERDGLLCWLCSKPIDFEAKPNSGKAWSIEHLLAEAHGGPDKMENLVLCHPPCNRVLGARSIKDKVRLRERRQRKLWSARVNGKKKLDPGSSPG
jgi:5-methylcytosine-specific restriction endonuclease McrA